MPPAVIVGPDGLAYIKVKTLTGGVFNDAAVVAHMRSLVNGELSRYANPAIKWDGTGAHDPSNPAPQEPRDFTDDRGFYWHLGEDDSTMVEFAVDANGRGPTLGSLQTRSGVHAAIDASVADISANAATEIARGFGYASAAAFVAAAKASAALYVTTENSDGAQISFVFDVERMATPDPVYVALTDDTWDILRPVFLRALSPADKRMALQAAPEIREAILTTMLSANRVSPAYGPTVSRLGLGAGNHPIGHVASTAAAFVDLACAPL